MASGQALAPKLCCCLLDMGGAFSWSLTRSSAPLPSGSRWCFGRSENHDGHSAVHSGGVLHLSAPRPNLGREAVGFGKRRDSRELT